ncbi:riboflavin biosynthesis protein RibD, partial [archaeon D22]
MTKKIILNLAISLDGYIADDYGGFDWIKGDGDKSHDTKDQFSFSKFLDSVEIIIMGRKAYDESYDVSKDMLKSKKVLVATHRPIENKPDNVEIISGDIISKVTEPKENIWLFGGGILIDNFIKADVIDEYIIGVIPIILGSGRPLFLKNNPRINLHLTECTVQEGIT